MSTPTALALRSLQLLAGLALYGLGLALMVRATLGVSPWDVLTQGLSLRTGLSFGVVIVIVGAIVLLAWIPLRVKPGVGTVLNVLLVGPAADAGLALLPAVSDPALRAMLLVAGIALVAIASGVYLGAGFGSGPRDGLMLGLRDRLGVPVWLGRTLVEGTVLALGWMLGGTAGIGTLAFALLIGPLVGVTLPWFRWNRTDGGPRAARAGRSRRTAPAASAPAASASPIAREVTS